jgi:hypothetical protein
MKGGPYFCYSVEGMKKLFLVVLILLPFLCSCASLMDGRFVPKDGRPSPYNPQPDPYEPPKDPTIRY